jgi:hypothetical protein
LAIAYNPNAAQPNPGIHFLDSTSFHPGHAHFTSP